MKRWRRSLILAILLAILTISIPFMSISQPSQSPSPSTSGIAVNLGDQPIFALGSKSHFSSLELRVKRVSNRITTFAKDATIPLEALESTDIEGNTVIYAEDMVLITVSDADAQAAGASRQGLASQYLQTIKQSVQKYREENSGTYLTQAILVSVLSTLALIVSLIILRNLGFQLHRWLDGQRSQRVPSLQIQNFELMTSNQLSDLLRSINNFLQLGLILSLLYFYSSFLLNLFPKTRPFGKALFGYVQNVITTGWNAFVGYIPNLMTIGLIIIFTYYFLGFLKVRVQREI